MYSSSVQILEWIFRWSRLSKVTYSLVHAFDSAFEPFGGAGTIGAKLSKDEFVIAYMFGVMSRFFDVHGTVGMRQSAQILWKCYERVFPGHGEEMVELATSRIEADNRAFMRNVRAGNDEAHEYLATKGNSGLPSLISYLTIACS